MDNKIKVTTGAFIIVSIFIIIEHFNDGVITHYLLSRKELPGFSNWWGLLSVPILAWIVATLLKHRKNKGLKSGQKPDENNKEILKRFVLALVFGIILSLLWELNLENILMYLILLPFLIAFFKPIHLPEILLGFVLGMIYTFGGILPIIFGLVLLLICFLINKLMSFLKAVVVSKPNT